MKHIVQFSGGAASAYVAWLVVEELAVTILFYYFMILRLNIPTPIDFANKYQNL
jgi:PP-loop superfamily ATP-utilizing enzyme